MGKKKGGRGRGRGTSNDQPQSSQRDSGQSGGGRGVSMGRGHRQDNQQQPGGRGRGRGQGGGRGRERGSSNRQDDFPQLGASASVTPTPTTAPDPLAKQMSSLDVKDEQVGPEPKKSSFVQPKTEAAATSQKEVKEPQSTRKKIEKDEKSLSGVKTPSSSQQEVEVTKATKKRAQPQQKIEVEAPSKPVLSEKQKRLTDYQIPDRPGWGKQGKKIQLESNFFEVRIPNITISQYDVTFFDGKNDDKAPKELTRRVFQKFVDENKKVFRFLPVYDGKKIMYVKTPLEFQGKKSFDVLYVENDRNRQFKITLQHSGLVDLSTLNDAIQGRRNSSINPAAINALDLVLRHAPSLRYIPMGSKFFKSDGAVNIGGGKEMWHGYHQSVRPSRWKLFLNIDVSATTFVRNVSVMEYMKEFFEESRRNIDLNRPMSDRDRKMFSKEIEGLKIYITYMGRQKRKYRVNGLKHPANKQTFSCEKDGKTSTITVQKYFSDEKNVQLRYPNLPCLHVGDIKKTIYLPMEVCHMVEGQHTRKLTENQTANMIKQTSKRPDVRHDVIGRISREANYNKDKWAKDFGIQVGNQPELVDARVLPPPGILYERDSKGMIPRMGAWNMKGKRLFQGANIESWAIIDYEHGRPTPQQAIDKFVNELVRAANGMGIRMGKPSLNQKVRPNMNAATLVENVLNHDRHITLLMVILHGTTPFYGQLKTICDTHEGARDISDRNIREHLQKNGVATQCVLDKNVFKCNPMTIAQLLLKINTKMGGVNNAIDHQNVITRPKRVFDEPVIFLGADVTHPGRGDKTRPSIAAVVGSIDSYPIRYAASVRAQTHRMEVIEDLTNIVKELLKQFYRYLGKKPAKIIMFRDGVSEGQFQQILQHELNAIQQACCQLETGYRPGITFVVVQKRHHARFKSLGETDRSGNCLAGTTIDQGVCHPTQFDYYQYSHAGIQGTSRPTHYHMLWDDNDFTADEMQALSFMLCHLYVRCTRSVSIPAPAYYAHHVAYRARYHLQKEEGSESSESGAQPEELYGGKFTKERLVELVRPSAAMVNRMYFV